MLNDMRARSESCGTLKMRALDMEEEMLMERVWSERKNLSSHQPLGGRARLSGDNMHQRLQQ